MTLQNMDPGYPVLLDTLKQKIRTAQIRASSSVNAELIVLYWEVGKSILQEQQKKGWGAKIIDLLSQDLKASFPGMKGFSPRNLKYMRKFAEVYPDVEIVQEAPAQITWYHNQTLLDKIKNQKERLWYTRKTIEFGWSRNVLVCQIESGLYQSQAVTGKTTNFQKTLPSPQ